MKKYVVPFIYWISILLIGTVLASTLYYFNITSDKINKGILYLISIISITISSFKFGMEMDKKGMISGLIFFVITSVIMTMLSLIIFKPSFNISNIIYFIILLVFSMIGSIVGRNKKEEAKT